MPISNNQLFLEKYLSITIGLALVFAEDIALSDMKAMELNYVHSFPLTISQGPLGVCVSTFKVFGNYFFWKEFYGTTRSNIIASIHFIYQISLKSLVTASSYTERGRS